MSRKSWPSESSGVRVKKRSVTILSRIRSAARLSRSSAQPLFEYMTGRQDLDTEAMRGGKEVANVVGDDCVGTAVDGGFENHFVLLVAELRTLGEVDSNLLGESGKVDERLFDALRRNSVRGDLVRPG